jgi:hypothetical protein
VEAAEVLRDAIASAAEACSALIDFPIASLDAEVGENPEQYPPDDFGTRRVVPRKGGIKGVFR